MACCGEGFFEQDGVAGGGVVDHAAEGLAFFDGVVVAFVPADAAGVLVDEDVLCVVGHSCGGF